MAQVLIDAYDPRHPEHEAMMDLECDAGLDIELLPTFEVMIEDPDSPAPNV